MRRASDGARLPLQRLRDDWCRQTQAVPEYARAWSDDDWMRYAVVAHDKFLQGDALYELDRAALARHPFCPDIVPMNASRLMAAYDSAVEVRPCVRCGVIVHVSCLQDRPMHHHCQWHETLGSACAFGRSPG